MYGHDGTKGDGCDATATHLNIANNADKLSYSQKKSIKDKWKEHQDNTRDRKLKNRKGRNQLHNELRKLQTEETPETYHSIKKFTIDAYKQRYPEEDWTDPYSDPSNGLSEYEDLESDESDQE